MYCQEKVGTFAKSFYIHPSHRSPPVRYTQLNHCFAKKVMHLVQDHRANRYCASWNQILYLFTKTLSAEKYRYTLGKFGLKSVKLKSYFLNVLFIHSPPRCHWGRTMSQELSQVLGYPLAAWQTQWSRMPISSLLSTATVAANLLISLTGGADGSHLSIKRTEACLPVLGCSLQHWTQLTDLQICRDVLILRLSSREMH